MSIMLPIEFIEDVYFGLKIDTDAFKWKHQIEDINITPPQYELGDHVEKRKFFLRWVLTSNAHLFFVENNIKVDIFRIMDGTAPEISIQLETNSNPYDYNILSTSQILQKIRSELDKINNARRIANYDRFPLYVDMTQEQLVMLKLES